ncbi:MAG: hypothetical protein V3V16_06235 [Melioribacteraceae bacterium]
MKIILTYFFLLSICLAQSNETKNWFEFNPYVEVERSKNIIQMTDWLDAPAGKHGIVTYKKDKLLFEDGTPVKFWGVNISGNDVFAKKKDVEKWAETLAMYGVNSVRFHKFSHPGMKDSISTDLKDENYEYMDYFSSALKEKGIYYGWSPIYGHKPKLNDSSSLLAYDEIVSANLDNHLSYSTIGLVNFAEDLQDLHVELIVNLLNHKNTYTGLKYANDPALSFIELQNEDDIFFATTEAMIEKCSTYKKLLTDRFSTWLIEKYQNQNSLRKVWGVKAFEWGVEVKSINWNLDKGNITPVANHGIYGYEFNKASGSNKPLPLFLTDMATFLFEQQSKFYQRFTEAIRNTGYKGLIVSSNWQAGSGVAHYFNLNADYKTGMVDRHNYFGGGTGHTFIPGKIKNTAMVKSPGYGLLSTGMQQVKDRPFSISEWLSLIPNEWTTEATPIIAAYGMGLQGWDASFSFDSQSPYFTPTIHLPNKHWPSVYNVMSPTNLVLYPVITRMLYRNDVKEANIISTRYVSLTELEKGNLGFDETITQDNDVKDFKGTIPNEALAVGKVVVEFTDKFEKTNTPNLLEYWDFENKIITSNTKQLKWNYSGDGYFTINTNGTKGVVGFTDGKEIKLDYLSIKVKTPFAVVLLTSLDKNKSITESKHILITTMARANNTAMKYNLNKTELLEIGETPIILEPVVVELFFGNYKILKVNVLDHVGNTTNNEIHISCNSVLLDGEKYKTMYYEIELE